MEDSPDMNALHEGSQAAPRAWHHDLTRSELEELLNHLPDPKVIVDAQGNIVFTSLQVLPVLGYAPGELLGKSLGAIIPPRFHSVHALRVTAYMRNPALRPMGGGLELFALTKDGRELPVEISLSSVGEGDRRVVVAGLRDISERKRAVEELKESNTALQQKSLELEDTIRDLRVLTQTASHDLQAPLRQISQFLTLLHRRHGAALPEDGREFIGLAIESAERLSSLVQSVLDYSRVGSLEIHRVAVALDPLVSDVLRSIRVLVEESGARVTMDPLPVVMGDRVQLARVFQNLVTNALTHRGELAPEIHVSAAPEGDRWRISIRDNGPGIPSEDHERVFEMFQRGSAAVADGGSGVGLAICKRVVQRHNGRLWVDSVPGEGSTFHFTLAGAPSPAEAAREDSAAA